MHPDIATALRLQDLDLRIASLEQEIASLPRELAKIERALESHTRKLELDRAALAANLRDRKKLEGDVQASQQKISKLRDQMLSAKTNEQYRAFQHEIDFCEAEISKAEDKILALMEESESLDANVKRAEVALAEEKRVVEAAKTKTRACTEEDKRALAARRAERASTSAALPAALLASYERLRARSKDGAALAEAAGEQCLACHMALRPQLFQLLKQGKEIIHCENCKRMLFYNPPQSFEAELDRPAPSPA